MYNKVLATVFITSSLIATPIFASHFFQNPVANPTKKISTANAQLKSKDEVNNFVDFSGTWVGNCTGHEGTDTMTIENSESQFIIDGEIFELGSLKTESTSDKDGTYFSHMLLEWNTDHSALLFNGSFAALAYAQNFNTFGYQKGTISLKNDQLIFEASTNFSDIENTTNVCTYQKK